MDKRKVVRLGIKEQFEVMKRLQEVLIIYPDGECSYRDDHSDKSIAAEFGVVHTAVQYRRQELFGNLKSIPRTDNYLVLERAFIELCQRIKQPGEEILAKAREFKS